MNTPGDAERAGVLASARSTSLVADALAAPRIRAPPRGCAPRPGPPTSRAARRSRSRSPSAASAITELLQRSRSRPRSPWPCRMRLVGQRRHQGLDGAKRRSCGQGGCGSSQSQRQSYGGSCAPASVSVRAVPGAHNGPCCELARRPSQTQLSRNRQVLVQQVPGEEVLHHAVPDLGVLRLQDPVVLIREVEETVVAFRRSASAGELWTWRAVRTRAAGPRRLAPGSPCRRG